MADITGCYACDGTGYRWDGFTGVEPCDCGVDHAQDVRLLRKALNRIARGPDEAKTLRRMAVEALTRGEHDRVE